MEQREYKAGNVEAATELALKNLNLTIEEVDIEVITKGGFFRKAVIKVEKKEETAPKKEESPKASQRASTKTKREFCKRDDKINPSIFVAIKSNGEGKEFIETVLKLMNITCSVEERQNGGEISFYITGEEAFKIIGYRGENLDALQHLVTYKLNKDKRNYERVLVDADFYRQKREQTLINLAKKLAKKAASSRKEVELEPMNAFERRIIHSALQGNRLASTRSDGEGRGRHIVVVPLENGEGKRVVNEKRTGNEKKTNNEKIRETEKSPVYEYKKYGAAKPKPETVEKESFVISPDMEESKGVEIENVEYGATKFSKTGPKRTKSFGYKKKKY